MSNLELARKFLLEIVHPSAKASVNDMFNVMTNNDPLVAFDRTAGFVIDRYLINTLSKNQAETLETAACCNGLFAGFMLGHLINNIDAQQIIKTFLENRSRKRGENVVNFLDRKGRI